MPVLSLAYMRFRTDFLGPLLAESLNVLDNILAVVSRLYLTSQYN